MRGESAMDAAQSGDGQAARRLRKGASVALVTGAIALSTWGVLAASADATVKVTLCHATDSETNPYVSVTAAAAGAYNGHYTEHQGDVWFSGHPKEPKWGDIIPPFVYRGHTYSLNWNAAGQAIFNAGCMVTAPSSSAASTTAASSTAASSTAASSTAASSTAASSTAASSIAASSIANTTVTTAGAPSSSFLAVELGPTSSSSAAAGPIPVGANAGLVAVSHDTSTPLWADALIAAAAAGLAGAGVLTARRGSARSH